MTSICTYCSMQGHTAAHCPRRSMVAWHMITFLACSLTVAMVALAGCSNDVIPPSRIAPPSPRLMLEPERLPVSKPGDNLAAEHLRLRKAYAYEVGRFRSLQRYTRIARGGA